MSEATPQRAAGLGPLAWIAVALLITGAMGTVLYVFITGFLSVRQDYARFEAPGEAQLSLSTPGTYLVYHEFKRSDDCVGYVRPPGRDEIQFELRDAAGNAVLPVVPATYKQTLAIRRTFAESFAQFQVDTPGQYVLQAVWEHAPDVEPLELFVRASAREVLWRTILRGASVLVATFLTVSLIVWRGSRRPG